MPRIRQLSQSVINKIAAGEVIERPASVVKELMENAVDSGATRIDVAIEQGGSALVRVVDNGCGIAADELTLAVAAHATSKIADADDLFRVATLGFRGEALASIAEVSQLAMRSRTSEDAAGAEVEVNGGLVRGPAPCGAAVGTQIEVRNLFFNTPVRRKFLKSTQTEAGHASEAFTRIALAHAGIHFTLRHNDRLLFDLPPTAELRGRIAALFGQELADRLIDVDNRDGDVRLWGYVADPSESRANNRTQYLFLNGRHIRDRSLQHALGEAYRGLLLTGRFPVAMLHLSMPAELIDVNVHPTKLEVRFADGGRLYSQLLGTLRARFLSTDLTARGNASRAEAGVSETEEFAATVDRDDFDAAAVARRQAELVDWAKGKLAEATAQREFAGALGFGMGNGRDAAVAAGPPRFDRADFFRPHAPLEVHRLDRTAGAGDFPDEEPEPEGLAEFERATADEPAPARPDSLASAYRLDAPHALQIHNRYIVTESPEGVVVIDQHALHERILYEQLRAKVLAGAVESQQLLVPEPVDLTPAEAAAVLDRAELLADLGIRVAPFGGGTIIVSSYPAMLANLSPAELLRDVVDRISTEGKTLERRDLVDELLHMIACKAAIKAGDRLTHDEITALLAARHLAEDAHHCPHGRPTALVFTREELDRQFKRT
ncbi:MAG: DNA mismatch repair endonuclease MutL [Planctomycetota bacterium]|nr:MAG: DNA mismatch repair endonuclease MutL [Planctomycetota bacterium]